MSAARATPQVIPQRSETRASHAILRGYLLVPGQSRVARGCPDREVGGQYLMPLNPARIAAKESLNHCDFLNARICDYECMISAIQIGAPSNVRATVTPWLGSPVDME